MTAPAAHLFNEHRAPTAAGCLVVGDLMRQMRPSGIDPTRVPSLLRNAHFAFPTIKNISHSTALQSRDYDNQIFSINLLRITISHLRQPHMAGFVDVRGSGLARAQRALAGLEEHPERLDRERRRFSDSPPPYKSDMSGTTTRSQSPNPPTEEQRLRQQRRMQLAGEREASEPRKQFRAQVKEERRQIWNTEPRTG